jgi:hypothetical protein
MKQSGDFVMNTSNQIWLMLNQKSANTKVVINNHVLITNETNGRFCAEHKQPEMVDVISKCCEYEGCNKRSYFNNSNETSGRFCKEHKRT